MANNRESDRAIQKTKRSTTMSIDELMLSLLDNQIDNHLPELDSYLNAMLDNSDAEFIDLLLPELREVEEVVVDKSRSKARLLNTERLTDIIVRLSLNRKQSSEESANLEFEKINIYELTPEEILEKIKCRCNELKGEYMKNKISDVGLLKETESAVSCSKRSQHRKRLTKSGSIFSTHHEATEVEATEAEASDAEASEAEASEAEASEAEATQEAATQEKATQAEATNCTQFSSVKDYATFFIDDLLVEAEQKVEASLPVDKSQESDKYAEGLSEQDSDMSSYEFSICSSIANKDFTPMDGRELILQSLETWQLRKPWAYCINFIAEDSDACADYYRYEIIWSLPTANCPIPQTTASVFYTIKVSRVTEDECPVIVTFNFETERYTFKLDDEINHEIFLDNIIKSKKNFYKSLRI